MKIKSIIVLLSIISSLFILNACSLYSTPSSSTPTRISSNTTQQTPLPTLNAERYPSGKTVSVKNKVQYVATDFNSLPSWHGQNFSGSLKSFQNSCIKLINDATWQTVCKIAQRVPTNNTSAKQFFEQNFTAWTVKQNNQTAGSVTGYYEPGIKGSKTQTATARFPIYGIPNDFISVPYTGGGKGTVRISQTGANTGKIDNNGAYVANLSSFPITFRTKALKGRIDGNRFVPYYTRAQINAGALNGKAPILGYADDAVELFFLQIQGSGRLILPNGSSIRLSYADKNDYAYVSIGKYMANKGYLPLAQTDMESIKNWLLKNPSKLSEVLGQNPSFVFFTAAENDNSGPVGALGVPLTAGFSAAVDKHHINLGAPIFVATTDPRNQKALNRLMVAQDTGSAITGAIRIDFFWGYGADAGGLAGKMKYPGYVWLLLPNGVLPKYQ